MSDPRLVFDTNVVVSAVLFLATVPARALELGQAVGRLLVSDETVEELRRVLMRTKFDRYVRSDERARFLGRVLDDAMLVEIIESIDDCRDPQGQQVSGTGGLGGRDASRHGGRRLVGPASVSRRRHRDASSVSRRVFSAPVTVRASQATGDASVSRREPSGATEKAAGTVERPSGASGESFNVGGRRGDPSLLSEHRLTRRLSRGVAHVGGSRV